MKLSEFKLDGWDNTYQTVYTNSVLKIVLLNLTNISGLDLKGRSNIVAVDSNIDISWIAEVPIQGRSIGWYHSVKINDKFLTAWYGYSIFVHMDLHTGRILKEEFIK